MEYRRSILLCKWGVRLNAVPWILNREEIGTELEAEVAGETDRWCSSQRDDFSLRLAVSLVPKIDRLRPIEHSRMDFQTFN